MTELQKFLLENDVRNIRCKVVLRRMPNFPFIVRPLTGDEQAGYQKVCVTVSPKSGARDFNVKRYQSLIVTNCVVEPNFKDADWLKQAGVASPEDLMNKTLLGGEISFLSEQILKFSGFGDDTEAEVEEVKNS